MVLNAAANIIGNIVEKNKAKQRLKKAELELVKEIDRIEADCLKAETFCLRVDEINKPLNKTIKAYDKIFVDTKALPFPRKNATKTCMVRRRREKKGEPYFTVSEKREFHGLYKAAGILTSLVDAEL